MFLTTSPQQPTRDHQHHQATETSMNDSNQTCMFYCWLYNDVHWSVNKTLRLTQKNKIFCNLESLAQGRSHFFHSPRHFLSDHFTNNGSKWPCGLTPLPAIYVYCHSLPDSIIMVLIRILAKGTTLIAKNRFYFSALVLHACITKYKWRESPWIYHAKTIGAGAFSLGEITAKQLTQMQSVFQTRTRHISPASVS